MVEQCWWNSDRGKMWSKRRTVLVEQCCGTVRRNSGTVLVEQCGEQCWWNNGTVMVDLRGKTVEQWWWNGISGTVWLKSVVEQ